MKEWYENMITKRFADWCELIQTNPKQALSCMADINTYKQMLKRFV